MLPSPHPAPQTYPLAPFPSSQMSFGHKSAVSGGVTDCIKKLKWEEASKIINMRAPWFYLEQDYLLRTVSACGDDAPETKFLRLLLRRISPNERQGAFEMASEALDSMSPRALTSFFNEPLKTHIDDYESVHAEFDASLRQWVDNNNKDGEDDAIDKAFENYSERWRLTVPEAINMYIKDGDTLAVLVLAIVYRDEVKSLKALKDFLKKQWRKPDKVLKKEVKTLMKSLKKATLKDPDLCDGIKKDYFIHLYNFEREYRLPKRPR